MKSDIRSDLSSDRSRSQTAPAGASRSYDAVRRYASSWSKATQEASASAYVPLSFDPGEARYAQKLVTPYQTAA